MLVKVIAGLDPVSAEALDNIFKACRILLERYSIPVLLDVENTWISDPIQASLECLPKIVLGEHEIVCGYAPKPEEFVELVLTYFDVRRSSVCYHPKGLDLDATFLNANTIE